MTTLRDATEPGGTRLPSTGDGAYRSPVQFQLLGPLEVTIGGERVSLGGPKQRLVLAHLLIRPNQIVSTELLIDEIWGEEPPDAARGSLQSYVSHLRKALGAERLEGRAPGYVLRVPAADIDAARFESLVTQARRRLRTDPSAAARALREALALWQGEPLADLPAERSLQAEIERLSEMRLAALEDRLEAELSLGLHNELVPEFERLVGRHPLRERLCGQLMLALYRAGRQAEALAAYHRLRKVLRTELGVDPSPAIEALQRRILNQDPALQLHGEPLRGYRLVEQIGLGEWGVVHRAFEPQTERDVAIKVLGARVANDAQFVRRFDAEARRIARLEHPHVLPIYDWWREPDAAYLVMRLVRGGDLSQRLASGHLGSATALTWAEQIGAALTAAHRQGLVHGDVRPRNILLDTDDNAYLTGFAVGYDRALNAQGTTVGSEARYLAPERRSGAAPSTAADIYAFGVLLSELLPGASLGEDGADLRAALERATALTPEERHPSAADLAAAIRRGLLAPTREVQTEQAGGPPRNPYKGLRSFEEADAADFFGREVLVGQLAQRLDEEADGARLLAVVGPSGSGKSSVVTAGLLPALRGGAVPGSDQWLIASMTPGQRPFEQLERALLGVAVNTPASLAELLEADDGLRSALERLLPPTAELLLVIDQFEELFTLSSERVRDLFMRVIARTIEDPRARLRVVITLRADFYDRPLRHERFGRPLSSSTHALPPLTPEELERAVSEPAQRAGLRLEPGLATRIVAEMGEQPGGLPLLQYALTELWERKDGSRLSLRAYDASGGIAGAVGRRAEQLVLELDPHGREAARQLFLRLIEPGEGTPDTSRRLRASELQGLHGERDQVEAVVESFVRYRLLLVDRDAETREPVLQLAHEALLRVWPRLQQWVDEAREDLRNQRRLAAAAGQWLESGRDSSFLLSGSRLEQTEQWVESTRVLLGAPESEYLTASLGEQRRVQAAEEERRAHEADLERRASMRQRALVVALALGTMLAVGLSLFALSESQRAASEARVATARELAAAAVANLEVDPERSVLLALEAINETRLADGSVLREAEEALHRAVVSSRAVLTVHEEGGPISWTDHPVLGSVFVTQGPEDSGLVSVRDASSGDVLRSWRAHEIDVNEVAFSADGSLLATAGDDGFLRVWDTDTQREMISFGGPAAGETWGPSFSPDGSQVAAVWREGAEDRDVARVLTVETGDEVVEIVDLGFPTKTSFSPDGKRIAVALHDGPVALVFDVATGNDLFALEGHDGGVNDVAYSPDGRWIATAADDSTAKVWDAGSGALRFTVFGHAVGVADVDWSPDSERLITGSLDGTARLWELSEAGPRQLMLLASQELRGGVGGVAFSSDGSHVMTAQHVDHAVKVWDVGIGGDAEWLNLPPGNYGGIAISPDSARLVASTAEGSIATWDLETLSRGLETNHHSGLVFAIAASPDGSLIASAGFDGTMVWDAATGELNFSVPLAHGEEHAWMQTVAWSASGDLLATASSAGPVTVRGRTGETIAVLPEGPRAGVYAARFSPDGRLLATSVKQAPGERWDPALHQVSIWDWARQTRVTTIRTSSIGLAFNPAGTLLVTANVEQGYGEVWDVTGGDKRATLLGHSGSVNDAAWDPDPERNWIATASDDATVRLWNAATGVTELVLRGHQGPVRQVRFSPDGSRLASIGRDGAVRVWALDLDDLIAIAQDKVTRELTEEECRQYLHLDACPSRN
jgi:WD40 repeat protein/DNA-binding SARP family transcriptional activator/serine/threonine protein kinase